MVKVCYQNVPIYGRLEYTLMTILIKEIINLLLLTY